MTLLARRGLAPFSTAVVVAGCWAVLLAPSASAAQQMGYSPLKQGIELAAGESTVVPITLSAPDEAIDVDVAHVDFGLDDGYDVVIIPDDAKETTAFSTRGWFSTPKQRYAVPAGGSITVPVRITVPKNQPSGTFLGAASFTMAPSGTPRGGQVQTRTGGVSLMFITVAGGTPPKPKVLSFDAARLVSGGTMEPQVRITNTGDAYFAVDGTIRIDGRARGGVTLPQQFVMPDQPRTLRSTNEDASGDIELDLKDLGIGRHEVVLRLRIDPTNDTLVVRRTFWLVPMWLRVVAALAALSAVLLVSWVVVRLRGRGAHPQEHGADDDELDMHDEDLGSEDELGSEHDLDDVDGDSTSDPGWHDPRWNPIDPV